MNTESQSFACPSSEPTGTRGLVAIDRGWNGWGWRCPDCHTESVSVDRYRTPWAAATALRRHRRAEHDTREETR